MSPQQARIGLGAAKLGASGVVLVLFVQGFYLAKDMLRDQHEELIRHLDALKIATEDLRTSADARRADDDAWKANVDGVIAGRWRCRPCPKCPSLTCPPPSAPPHTTIIVEPAPAAPPAAPAAGHPIQQPSTKVYPRPQSERGP